VELITTHLNPQYHLLSRKKRLMMTSKTISGPFKLASKQLDVFSLLLVVMLG